MPHNNKKNFDEPQDSFLLEETIINFTRAVWREYFPRYKTAPKTLSYDSKSLIPRIDDGFCHIAHDYMNSIYDDYDADAQIYAMASSAQENSYIRQDNVTVINDINNLPLLECVVFISCYNTINAEKILDKLIPEGIAIVLNECIILPEEWIDITSCKEKLRSIKAFARS